MVVKDVSVERGVGAARFVVDRESLCVATDVCGKLDIGAADVEVRNAGVERGVGCVCVVAIVGASVQ